MGPRHWLTVLGGASALIGLPLAARADAIDGSWCGDSGRHLAIEGPSIVTPGGHAIQGDYQRHYFSYVAPADERDAGATIRMRLLNEFTMQLRAGESAAVETWHRCAPPVS